MSARSSPITRWGTRWWRLSLPGGDVVHKVSIIPRGIGSLGYTIQRPTEDRYLMTRAELESKMAVLLGGRAAERLIFDELSTGAADDLAKATDIARAMVTRYGMVEQLGQITYDREQPTFLGGPPMPHPREFSEVDRARDRLCCPRAGGGCLSEGAGRPAPAPSYPGEGRGPAARA